MAEFFSSIFGSAFCFANVLNSSIAASWMIFAVIVFRLILSRAPKKIHVVLWGLVALRLIIPFSIESPLSLIPSAETVTKEILSYEGVKLQETAQFNVISNPSFLDGLTVDMSNNVSGIQSNMAAFNAIWFAGILAFFAYAIISEINLRKRVAEATLMKENIYRSEKMDSPFILGVIRPRIYIPYDICDEDIHYVIEHEKTHIIRKDNWWKLIGFICLTIHWFNPLIWIAFIFLSRDIELACDEEVIKNLENEDRACYTKALLDCSVKKSIAVVCSLTFGEIGVKERVKNVLNYRKPSLWIMTAAIAAIIVVAACFLTDPVSNSGVDADFEQNENMNISEGWIYTPSKDPLDVVRSALEGQKVKEYTIKLEIKDIDYADGETFRMKELYKGSELAASKGWTNEYLDEHFLAIRAEYSAEYDETKTFIQGGDITQNFYLTENLDTGLWEIFDNSSYLEVL